MKQKDRGQNDSNKKQKLRGTFVTHVILHIVRAVKNTKDREPIIDTDKTWFRIQQCGFKLNDFKEDYEISRQTKYRLVKELFNNGFLDLIGNTWLPSERFYNEVLELFSTVD